MVRPEVEQRLRHALGTAVFVINSASGPERPEPRLEVAFLTKRGAQKGLAALQSYLENEELQGFSPNKRRGPEFYAVLIDDKDLLGGVTGFTAEFGTEVLGTVSYPERPSWAAADAEEEAQIGMAQRMVNRKIMDLLKGRDASRLVD